VEYDPAGVDEDDIGEWMDATRVLGPVTGDHFFGIVSLGEMNAAMISAYLANPQTATEQPGSITLEFDETLFDGPGPDLAVFENAIGSTIVGSTFAELGYVEVSSDGVNFARFPADSLTPEPSPTLTTIQRQYMGIEASNVYNLAGKHHNNTGESWGTPFDLAELKDDPLVLNGTVDLQRIRFARVVDIPGSGDFRDAEGDPIYDAWETTGSGGLDLEAIGLLRITRDYATWQREEFDLPADSARAGMKDDFDGDGAWNIEEFAYALAAKTPDAAGLPQLTLERITPGDAQAPEERVVLRYPRHTARQAAGLRYVVKVSRDMSTWHAGGFGLVDERDPNVPPVGDVEFWRASVPLGEQALYLKIDLFYQPQN
jgi:hypothetical protein